MSTFPNTVAGLPIARSRGLSPIQYAALATTLAVLGLSTIWFRALAVGFVDDRCTEVNRHGRSTGEPDPHLESLARHWLAGQRDLVGFGAPADHHGDSTDPRASCSYFCYFASVVNGVAAPLAGAFGLWFRSGLARWRCAAV